MRGMGYRFLGLLLLFLLAACGGQTGGGDNRRVNATIGTWDYGGQNVGAAFILWADLPEPTSPDGFTVQISGPNSFSWNRTLRNSFSGPVFGWWLNSNLIPSTGTYNITASLPGGLSLNRQVSLDASVTLPRPQNITVQATTNTATISWSSVAGASSYSVELWQLDGQGNLFARRFFWHTRSTQVQFTQAAQIVLPPGNYRAWVSALSLDLVSLNNPGRAPALDSPFRVSSGWSQQAIQVQSTGVLRVVDLPSAADPGGEAGSVGH